MEKEIYFTNNDFNFNDLSLSHPISTQGGAYFTKLKMTNDSLYIQLPKCHSKQGLIETNKKAYIDLIFTNDDYDLIEWFENLENKLIDLVHKKKDVWFQNDMERDDIEQVFNPICRAYKGGKFYLIRINIVKNKIDNSQYNCDMYDENQNIIPIKELNDTQCFIPVLEVSGIKFSSKSFQLEISGKQMMILDDKPLFNSCIIKRDNIKKDIIDNVADINKVDKQESSNDHIETKYDNIVEKTDDNVDVIVEKTDDNVDADNVADNVDDNVADNVADNVDDNVADNVDNNTILTIDSKLNSSIITDNQNISSLERSLEENDNNLESYGLEDITNKIIINNNESINIKLKKPNEVYYDIYKLAKQQGRKHKKAAISAYLEAKQIKNTYIFDDLDDDSDSSSDEYDSESEKVKNEINEIVEQLI